MTTTPQTRDRVPPATGRRRRLLTLRKLLIAAAFVVVAVLILRPRSNWPQPVWSQEMPGWVGGWSDDSNRLLTLAPDESAGGMRVVVAVDAATGERTAVGRLRADAFDEKSELARLDQLADGRLVATSRGETVSLLISDSSGDLTGQPLPVMARTYDAVHVYDVRQVGQTLLVVAEDISYSSGGGWDYGRIELATIPLDGLTDPTGDLEAAIVRHTITGNVSAVTPRLVPQTTPGDTASRWFLMFDDIAESADGKWSGTVFGACAVEIAADGTLAVGEPASFPLVDAAAGDANRVHSLYDHFNWSSPPAAIVDADGQPLEIPGDGVPFAWPFWTPAPPLFNNAGWMLAYYRQNVFIGKSRTLVLRRFVLAHFTLGDDRTLHCDRLFQQSRMERGNRKPPIDLWWHFLDPRFSPDGRWLLTYSADGEIAGMCDLDALLRDE